MLTRRRPGLQPCSHAALLEEPAFLHGHGASIDPGLTCRVRCLAPPLNNQPFLSEGPLPTAGQEVSPPPPPFPPMAAASLNSDTAGPRLDSRQTFRGSFRNQSDQVLQTPRRIRFASVKIRVKVAVKFLSAPSASSPVSACLEAPSHPQGRATEALAARRCARREPTFIRTTSTARSPLEQKLYFRLCRSYIFP